MPVSVRPPQHLFTAVRLLGLGWLMTRTNLALRRRCGIYERQYPLRARKRGTPPVATLSATGQRFMRSAAGHENAAERFAAWDTPAGSPLPLADAVLDGVFPYFGHTSAALGHPPDWFVNPFTAERAPCDLHWSRIGDFAHGDIKVIWEPSRFGWAYALVRAYHRTSDERYADGFWRLLEHWCAANPPHAGANWMCGQETGFRLLAWCFALRGLAGSAASTASREARLLQGIALAAEN